MNSALKSHYAKLLDIEKPWIVESVQLEMKEQRITIELEEKAGARHPCPDCGDPCPVYDHGGPRHWRHLDVMQFETRLIARLPRVECPRCGVSTVTPPWAGKHSRFTLLFEAFALSVLQATDNHTQAARILRLSWNSIHTLMGRAVERGLERREREPVPQVGLDEKSFGRGQSYISLLNDLDNGRVLEVVQGRRAEDADRLWSVLSTEQLQRIEAVAVDMWAPFVQSIQRHAPQADIVHDKFHVSKHLGDAIDAVRRREHKALAAQGDSPLTGTRYLWLYNQENLEVVQRVRFEPLRDSSLRTARAWAIREFFSSFWTYQTPGWARRFFERWYSWAIRSRLDPIKRVARMLKRHLDHLVTYATHGIDNAVSEGLNSKIQSLKHAARGFRSFDNYRIRILFHCGKLDVNPLPESHPYHRILTPNYPQ